jgi:oligopeptide/dipeptide ABC transporter ATP-binding protein
VTERSILEVNNLRKTFAVRRSFRQKSLEGARDLVALDGVSLNLNANEVLGIVGESGSGKSTLARCIVRLYEPDSGRVTFDAIDVLAAQGPALRDVRRRMQLIYQDPYSSLNPRMTVEQALAEAVRVHGIVDRQGVRPYITELLERVGLAETHLQRRPRQLSGGQRQRVAIARALSVKPEVLIADEPLSALDVSIQTQILNVFEETKRAFGLAMLFISHQLAVVGYIADRVVIMYLGRIVESGPTRDLFTQPAHPYTRVLLRAHPPAGPRRPRPTDLKGEIPSAVAIPSGCRFHTRCAFAQAICSEVDPPPVQISERHISYCHFADRIATSADADTDLPEPSANPNRGGNKQQAEVTKT